MLDLVLYGVQMYIIH